MFKLRKTALLVTILGLSLLSSACGGQSNNKTQTKYPTKSINLVVPYAAGGSSDLSARPYAEELGNLLGQSIVVVNKTGAGGAIGAADVSRQKPDGYNLLNASVGNITIAPYTANVGYDYKSFTPIAQMTDIPLCISVNSNSTIKNLKDFVEYAKQNPGKVRYGNPGAGNIQHVMMEGWAKKEGMQVVAMPFEGANPAVAALLGNHIESTFTSVTEVAGHAKSGSLRVIGITSAKRIKMLPDVPTFKEQGYDMEGGLWYGVLAPKNLDPVILKLLADNLKKAYDSKKTQDAWEKLYLIPSYLGPEEFSARIESEASTNKKILEEIGLAKKN